MCVVSEINLAGFIVDYLMVEIKQGCLAKESFRMCKKSVGKSWNGGMGSLVHFKILY